MNETVNRSPVEALLRHFADLRDGDHGGARERTAKEALFGVAVELMDPVVRAVLAEVDSGLLLGTGTVGASGVGRDGTGGLRTQWTLTWPEQRAADLPPISVTARYGSNFHHPHLRGATVGEWPLNVFDEQDARAELPTVRAIVAADLHNMVYQRDFRIIPATTRVRRSG